MDPIGNVPHVNVVPEDLCVRRGSVEIPLDRRYGSESPRRHETLGESPAAGTEVNHSKCRHGSSVEGRAVGSAEARCVVPSALTTASTAPAAEACSQTRSTRQP